MFTENEITFTGFKKWGENNHIDYDIKATSDKIREFMYYNNLKVESEVFVDFDIDLELEAKLELDTKPNGEIILLTIYVTDEYGEEILNNLKDGMLDLSILHNLIPYELEVTEFKWK